MLYLNGSIQKLLNIGYASIDVDKISSPSLPGEVLKGWVEFRKMDTWEKEFYLFDALFPEANPVPGSPGYFSYLESLDTHEYLYFNKYLMPRLHENEIDYTEHKAFFDNLAGLKKLLHDAALEIARAIDEVATPRGIPYESVIKKRSDAACLRLSSSNREAYKMRDPFRKKEFFLALQLYRTEEKLKFLTYFGQHAAIQSNGFLDNRNGQFALSGNDEILPICCLI